jgi:ornithine cyclodeaminase/alanine dehydrogenase-like protein (mu-crystallin family)
MAILLDSEDIEQILTPRLCLDALEAVFPDLSKGDAASMLGREVVLARAPDVEVPGARPGHVYHGLEVQSGTAPMIKTASLRVKSDMLFWPETDQGFRRKKYPAAGDGLFCGFVILFDTDTGEPTAIMPDGLIQRMRVGATAALGAKYLSREESSVVCVIGAGFQAETQIMTLNEVRDLEEVRIYSPTPQSRETLAGRLDSAIEARVVAIDAPEEAVKGSDIVHAATNSRAPVIAAEWLEEGMHVGVIGEQEIGEDVLRVSDVLATSRPYSPRQSNTAFADGFAEDVHEDEFRHGWWHNESYWTRMANLGDLILGRSSGRQNASDITTFINKGAAVQFTATGAALLEAAKAAGLGRDFPTEWLLQPYQP